MADAPNDRTSDALDRIQDALREYGPVYEKAA